MRDADPTTESEGFRAYKAGLAARRMPENAPKRQNRYNRKAGDLWRDQCISWLRDFGWKGAGPVLEKTRGDILGIGDVTIECTLEAWQHVWPKLAQVTRDAANNRHDLYGVWRKRNGAVDPGRGVVLVPAEVFWRAAWRLEKLEQAELEAADQLQKGFTMGVDWARANPPGRPQTQEVRQ